MDHAKQGEADNRQNDSEQGIRQSKEAHQHTHNRKAQKSKQRADDRVHGRNPKHKASRQPKATRAKRVLAGLALARAEAGGD